MDFLGFWGRLQGFQHRPKSRLDAFDRHHDGIHHNLSNCNMDQRISTHARACTHPRTRVNTYIHTCMHTYMHTCMHIYTDERQCFSRWEWYITNLGQKACFICYKSDIIGKLSNLFYLWFLLQSMQHQNWQNILCSDAHEGGKYYF